MFANPVRRPATRRIRLIWGAATVAMLALVGAGLGPLSASASSTGSIAGVVSGADTAGAGLANANITLTLAGGTQVANTSSDSSGAYSFTGLSAAKYVVQIQPDYTTNYLTTSVPVTIADGQAVTGLNAVLPVGGTISGTVSLSTGPLAQPAGVALIGSTATSTSPGDLFSMSTASDGTFTFVGVAPGSYTIAYTGPFGSNLAPQFWQSATSIATASYFTVAAGQAVTGKDAVLQPGSSVSGTVTSGAAHSPVASASVQALAADGTVIGNGSTAADGTYSITGLGSGSITLEFIPPFSANYLTQWWQGASSQAVSSYFDVPAGGALTGYDAQLAPGATISGTILDSSGNPVPYATASALKAGDTFPTQGFADSTGAYTIPALTPGDYTVSFDGSGAGNDAASWWNNATSPATATVIHVTDQQQVTGVNATLTPGGSISGTVSGLTPSGVVFPAANATIDAVRADGSVASEVYADNSGAYTIANLVPGTYDLHVFPQGDTTDFLPQWYRGQTSQATATPVTVSAGQSLTGVDVTLAAAVTTPPLTTATPKILGVPRVGFFLLVNPGKWGPAHVALSFQWLRNGTPIAGATSPFYRVVTADAGATLTVAVTGRKSGYSTATVASAPTPLVTGGRLQTATPTVSGTARVGGTLTVAPGVWGPSPVGLTLQWYRDRAPIPGATATNYTVTGADRGTTITVVVTGTKPGFTTATEKSTGLHIAR
jgi:hypothetical protein